MVFLEVNRLILLAIFLVYVVGCLILCQRMFGLCSSGCGMGTFVWRILFCGIAALILMVLTVYLWFGVVLFLMIVTRQLCRRYHSDMMRILVTTVMTILMILVAVAGLQMMLCTEDDEDDDDSDARGIVIQAMLPLEDRY